MKANKLKKDDELRIIAPSNSFIKKFTVELQKTANLALENMGFRVSFGKYVREIFEFNSARMEHRLEDLHQAFSDPHVKAILPVMGGTTSNQLLKHIDYDLIRKNPKIICGLSDFTSLANALFIKSGLMVYYGPHFAAFTASKKEDYTISYFKKCLLRNEEFEVFPADHFMDSEWKERKHPNHGFWNVNAGEAEGQILGGNFLNFSYLQGCEYIDCLDDKILFLEDNHKISQEGFFKQLQAMINQPGFEKVRGLVFGRFQTASKIEKTTFIEVIKRRKELKNIPIVANVDFGHTLPMITFPIGGTVRIQINEKESSIKILDH